MIDSTSGARKNFRLDTRRRSEEREEIKQLKRENAELRRANEILKPPSLFVATELDTNRPT